MSTSVNATEITSTSRGWLTTKGALTTAVGRQNYTRVQLRNSVASFSSWLFSALAMILYMSKEMVTFLLKSDLLVFRTSGIHWSILSACWGYYTAVMLNLFYGVMLRRFKTSLSRSVKHGPWRAILLSNKLSKNWYFTRSGISAQLCLCCVCLNKVPRGPLDCMWVCVGSKCLQKEWNLK